MPDEPDQRDQMDLLEAAHALSDAVAALNRDMELHAVYRAVSAGASSDPGIVMGWMGLQDAARQIVKPVAWWGRESGYLKDLRVTLDDTAHGRGPAGRAFLTGKPSIVDSIDDPDFSPWRDEAAKRGYLSVVGLPLHDTEDRVFGVLVLYSDRRRYFTPMRTALFQVFARSAGLAVQNAQLVQRLETQAQELEQRVQERTRELEARNTEMQEANRLLTESARYKSDFLSNMSHELRSPLTAIMGFSEVLRDELYGPLNAKQKEHSGHIWQAGRHLLDTINDILELSRIESGRTELDVGQCFPRQIFDAAGTMLLQLATTQGVALDWQVDPSAEVPIEADARKLKQAVFNLGSRLVKAAGGGGQVRMKASVEGERLHIDLAWRRADPDGATPARGPITGFGVTLAQQLVRLHGGDTTFDTPPDAAGRYRLNLPVRVRPAEHANAASEE